MSNKITKAQVLKWLEEQFDEWSGKFMDAEEAENDDKMSKAQEKTDLIEDLIDNIKKL